MSVSKSPLRTPLARVRGTGSAHVGVHHWIVERVTALALVPLSVWLVVGLVNHAIGSDRAMLAEWIAKPEVALALAAFLVAGFWHTKLGLQVIAEDYIHSKGLAFATLLFSSAACLVLGAMALLAVAHLNFFGI